MTYLYRMNTGDRDAYAPLTHAAVSRYHATCLTRPASSSAYR